MARELPLGIKKLPKATQTKLASFNEARRQAGLTPLRVRVRRCMHCGKAFESVGARFCGCITRQTSQLFGKDLI